MLPIREPYEFARIKKEGDSLPTAFDSYSLKAFFHGLAFDRSFKTPYEKSLQDNKNDDNRNNRDNGPCSNQSPV